jgi:hypothetical protein
MNKYTVKYREDNEFIKNINSIDYFSYNISTEQNNDDSYIEKGMVTICDVQGLNFIRRNISKIKNRLGLQGTNTYMYNYCINSLLKKVKNEMIKQNLDKISNAKIKFIVPQKSASIKISKKVLKKIFPTGDDGGGGEFLNIFGGDDGDEGDIYNAVDDELHDINHNSYLVLKRLTAQTRVNVLFIGTGLTKI